MRVISYCLVLAAFLISPLANAEELSKNKTLLIDQILKQSGQSGHAMGRQLSDLYIHSITQLYRESYPSSPEIVYEVLVDEVRAVIHEEFIDKGLMTERLHQLYGEHFTEDDLQTIVDFNNTELGQKMLKVMPMITRQAMITGKQIGRDLGPLVQQRFEARLIEEGLR